MAYSYKIPFRGVCGNFRFKVYNITDAASTNSVINTNMRAVKFIAATNTSDNADHFAAKTLNWSGTCDADVSNEIKDTTQTFVAQLTGSQAFNTTDNLTCTKVGYKDGDELYTYKSDAAYDLCPDGNEAYKIIDNTKIMVTPVTGNDDGTLFVIGE